MPWMFIATIISSIIGGIVIAVLVPTEIIDIVAIILIVIDIIALAKGNNEINKKEIKK